MLNAGKKVAMLVGQGALAATDEVLAVAEKLGAGIITALLGKWAVPGDIPYPHDEDTTRLSEQTLMLSEFLERQRYTPPKLSPRRSSIRTVTRSR